VTHSFPHSLQDRVVLVIGGTSGLGLSAARALSGAGARVVVTGRGQEKVDAALAELGTEAVGLAADAAAPGSAEAAVALAVERFGRLDALYHVAGGSGRSRGDGPLHEVTDEGIDYTIDLNLKSVLRSNRAAVRQFLAQGGAGAILNMGSVLGFSPSPEFFSSHVYAATKAAIIGFSKSLAARYAIDDIRVNVLAPALVETPMAGRAAGDATILAFIRRKQPLDGGRIGRPDDLDAAALFFLSDASRFATGQVLAIDGGWSVSEGR
jgi:NAD(P)-dependent dehydrogenase (short-subunit alcohol dehydrogenase family)